MYPSFSKTKSATSNDEHPFFSAHRPFSKRSAVHTLSPPPYCTHCVDYKTTLQNYRQHPVYTKYVPNIHSINLMASSRHTMAAASVDFGGSIDAAPLVLTTFIALCAA